jgi:hypothetical protein
LDEQAGGDPHGVDEGVAARGVEVIAVGGRHEHGADADFRVDPAQGHDGQCVLVIGVRGRRVLAKDDGRSCLCGVRALEVAGRARLAPDEPDLRIVEVVFFEARHDDDLGVDVP